MIVKKCIANLNFEDFKQNYKKFWHDPIDENELWNKIKKLQKNYPCNENDKDIDNGNTGIVKFIFDGTEWFPKVYINVEKGHIIEPISTDFINISDYVNMRICKSVDMSDIEHTLLLIYDMTFYGWSDKEIEDTKNMIIFS